MIPNFRVILGFGLNSYDWNLDFVDSFLPWSEITGDVKDFICVELFFAGLEVDLIDIFLGHFDDVFDLGFGEVLDLDLFGGVDSGEGGGEIDLALVFNLDIGLGASTNKSHLSIWPRHIV